METHLYNLAECLGKRVDLDVVVYTQTGQSSVEERENFRLHRLSIQANIAGQPISLKLPAYLRNFPADIIHVHHPNPYALLAYRLSRHPGKLVVTYHSDIVRQRLLGALITPTLDRVWRKTSAFSANSAPFVESSPVLRRYRERVHVVPHGIEPSPYLQSDTAESLKLRATHGTPLFLCVGRCVGYKGFVYAIEAMELLQKADMQAHLIIVGAGPLYVELRSKVRQLGLENSITMPGRVENTLPYYQAADVFVFPSCESNETLGLVQVEAMMCGKPVINTALPTGVPHVSLHNETGLTVPPKESCALAEAMMRLIKDSALRCQMGEAARTRALREYTAEKSAELTYAIYEQILRST
jgi:glycosyltransferase involved in cell wall biosynthesis